MAKPRTAEDIRPILSMAEWRALSQESLEAAGVDVSMASYLSGCFDPVFVMTWCELGYLGIRHGHLDATNVGRWIEHRLVRGDDLPGKGWLDSTTATLAARMRLTPALMARSLEVAATEKRKRVQRRMRQSVAQSTES